MKCFTRVALYILNGDASLRILSTDASGCFFINVTFIAVAEISIRGDKKGLIVGRAELIRNKILSGGDLSHYQVPHCIRVFFYFV